MLVFIGPMGEFLLPPPSGPNSRYSASQNQASLGTEKMTMPPMGGVTVRVRLADWPSGTVPKSRCVGEYWAVVVIGSWASPGFASGGVGVGDGRGAAGAADCEEFVAGAAPARGALFPAGDCPAATATANTRASTLEIDRFISVLLTCKRSTLTSRQS